MKYHHIINALAGSYSLLNRTTYVETSCCRCNTRLTNPRHRGGKISVELDWIGVLTYTPGGYLSAITASTNPELRPLVLGWPPKTIDSVSDWAQVGKSSFCFAGPFHISPDLPASITSGQLVHGPMEVTTLPSFMGVSEIRNYTLDVRRDGTYLTWHLWLNDNGSDRVAVYWKKHQVRP